MFTGFQISWGLNSDLAAPRPPSSRPLPRSHPEPSPCSSAAPLLSLVCGRWTDLGSLWRSFSLSGCPSTASLVASAGVAPSLWLPSRRLPVRTVLPPQHPSPLSPYRFFSFQLSSVQSLSRVRLSATPGTAACQASLSVTDSQGLLKLTVFI